MNVRPDIEDKTAPPSFPRTEALTDGAARFLTTGEIRILIADDDQAICELITSALSGNDYAIDSVFDPTRLEAQLRSKKYHLIILDYVIPGLASEQVFHWVQEYQKDASVIVVTGYPSVNSALNCLRARTFDYLTKPFEVAQLKQVVARCLEAKGLLRLSADALREALENLRESLGTVIRERRKALDLTLKQLADKTDVSLGYLSQIELGKNSASIETLYKISLGLGLHLTELFDSVPK